MAALAHACVTWCVSQLRLLEQMPHQLPEAPPPNTIPPGVRAPRAHVRSAAAGQRLCWPPTPRSPDLLWGPFLLLAAPTAWAQHAACPGRHRWPELPTRPTLLSAAKFVPL